MPLSALLKTSEVFESPAVARFATAVCDGLSSTPKTLPPEYFYDDVGSALFETITVLPEYGLTRADRRILANNAQAIARQAPNHCSVLELGSGSGSKTAHVLRAIARRQGRVDYYPIDVSKAALDCCERELSGIAEVHPVHASFVEGVRQALAHAGGGPVLVLFLGSTIGNFDRDDAGNLLEQIRDELLEDDCLLIGTDLVKPVPELLLAYDDPAGVTAAFNRNLLARINRELGGNFDLRRFRHEARYNPRENRVEMHLVSMCSQSVEIQLASCVAMFQPGESIWTESSHKYEMSTVMDMARRAGFEVADSWTDEEWAFAESLWIAA